MGAHVLCDRCGGLLIDYSRPCGVLFSVTSRKAVTCGFRKLDVFEAEFENFFLLIPVHPWYRDVGTRWRGTLGEFGAVETVGRVSWA